MLNPHLQELYQEVVLDHNKHPRNFKVIDPATHRAHGHNPLCGDQLDIYLTIINDVIKEIAFQGKGCAISTASASLMTDAIKGKSVTQALDFFAQLHASITHDQAPSDESLAALGKLAVITGVRDYPSRVKCALLAWRTLESALTQQTQIAKTE